MARSRRVFSPAKRAAIAAKTRGRCASCGGDLGTDWWAQHVTPWANGGTNDIDNLIGSCAHCNRIRSNGTPEEIQRMLEVGYALVREIRKQSRIGREVAEFMAKREARLEQKRKYPRQGALRRPSEDD